MTHDYKDLLAIYAAGLSTVLAYFTIRDKLRSIRFHYDEVWYFSNGEPDPYMVFSIVNLGEKNIVIRKIIIQYFIKRKQIIERNTDENYSEKLSYAEHYKFSTPILEANINPMSFDLSDLDDKTKSVDEKYLTTTIYTPSKLRIRVVDTSGKTHNSKWIPIRKTISSHQRIINW